MGLAVCFILASYSGCDRLQAILFFSFASGFAGLDNSRVNNMDLSPNYAPTIIAIVNSLGSIMGIVAPIAVGQLTPNVSFTFHRLPNDLDPIYLHQNNVALSSLFCLLITIIFFSEYNLRVEVSLNQKSVWAML